MLKKPKVSSSSSASKIDTTSYKTTAGSSQYKFSVLAKIVKHLKTKYQENDDYPLSLDEILDETNQLDVGSKVCFFFVIIYQEFLYLFNIFSKKKKLQYLDLYLHDLY